MRKTCKAQRRARRGTGGEGGSEEKGTEARALRMPSAQLQDTMVSTCNSLKVDVHRGEIQHRGHRLQYHPHSGNLGNMDADGTVSSFADVVWHSIVDITCHLASCIDCIVPLEPCGILKVCQHGETLYRGPLLPHLPQPCRHWKRGARWYTLGPYISCNIVINIGRTENRVPDCINQTLLTP